MNEIHTDIYHICKTNTDVIELEIFKLIKNSTPYLFLSANVFRFNRIFYKPMNSIFYTYKN